MHSSIGLTNLEPTASTSTLGPAPVPHVARPTSAVRFRRYVTALEVTADFVTVIAAVMFSYALYYLLELGKQVYYSRAIVLGVSVTLAAAIGLMLDRVGAYSQRTSLLRVRETEHVLRVSLQALSIAFAVSFFASFLFSRWLLAIALVLVPLSLFIQKHLIYLLVQRLHANGYGIERVLIFGSGSTGRRVFSVLSRSPKLGMEPLAFVDENPNRIGKAVFELGYENRRKAAVICGPITRNLVRTHAADLVIIAIPSLQQDKFHAAVQEILAGGARVSFVPNHFLYSDPWLDFEDFDGVLLASYNRNSRRTIAEVAKRSFDFLGSMALLVLCSPLFCLLWILVKLDSPGPSLFKQERVGLRGRHFWMYKFRTMHTNAPPYAYSPRQPNDRRITPLGRFLRRTSLDELPQLLNVLQGSMSLVGPRPEMPFIVENYRDHHRQRLRVKPGITGLWQLSADRAYLIHENIDYDLYYIQHQNFFMDIAILLHTCIFAMRGI
jgi:exopolysaccharide biosynthesis polyprenyl glycosylphosphotransferase